MPIVFEPKALEDAGIGRDTPVTREFHQVSLDAGLRILLEEFDLTYDLRDEMVVVTTKDRAENTVSLAVYPVGNFVRRDSPSGTTQVDATSVINALTTTVHPASWGRIGWTGDSRIPPRNVNTRRRTGVARSRGNPHACSLACSSRTMRW